MFQTENVNNCVIYLQTESHARCFIEKPDVCNNKSMILSYHSNRCVLTWNKINMVNHEAYHLQQLLRLFIINYKIIQLHSCKLCLCHQIPSKRKKV